MDQTLFEKNLLGFSAAIENSHHPTVISEELASSVRSESLKCNSWKPSNDNYIVLQPYSLDQRVQNGCIDELSRFEFCKNIEQYLGHRTDDPHLSYGRLQLSKSLDTIGFDSSDTVTIAQYLDYHFVLVLATGEGSELLRLINQFKPDHLFVAVSDWHDLASSFWTIDWGDLYEQFESAGKKITIGYFDTGLSVLSSLYENSLTGIDHTPIYFPSEARSRVLPVLEELKGRLPTSIAQYLGFTLDEYNMVWNSWDSLRQQPRVFKQPSLPVGGQFVLCGSGPSLDQSLEQVRTLSASHIIVACASNFKSLRKAGIRVDILILLERAVRMVPIYTDICREYGSENTLLFASVTCPYELHSLFTDTTIYYRPALTPLSIFSEDRREVLSFESPQSTNPGLSLLSSIKADKIVLVGCDFGVSDLTKVRAADAADYTDREFPLQEIGNFGNTVYTQTLLQDGRDNMERCIKAFELSCVYNASNGIKIDGTSPISIDDYIAHHHTQESYTIHLDKFNSWWSSLRRFEPDQFYASWNAYEPRRQCLTVINELKTLFLDNSKSWNILSSDVTKALSLSAPKKRQFPIRIIRATILKLCLMINRQSLIMSKAPDQQAEFLYSSRHTVVEILDIFSRELLLLCDTLELN